MARKRCCEEWRRVYFEYLLLQRMWRFMRKTVEVKVTGATDVVVRKILKHARIQRGEKRDRWEHSCLIPGVDEHALPYSMSRPTPRDQTKSTHKLSNTTSRTQNTTGRTWLELCHCDTPVTTAHPWDRKAVDGPINLHLRTTRRE